MTHLKRLAYRVLEFLGLRKIQHESKTQQEFLTEMEARLAMLERAAEQLERAERNANNP